MTFSGTQVSPINLSSENSLEKLLMQLSGKTKDLLEAFTTLTKFYGSSERMTRDVFMILPNLYDVKILTSCNCL